MATVAVDVADRLVAQGIGVTVVDPRWVKPVDPAIVELAAEHELVVSVEDNGRVGGCGAVLLQTLNDAGVTTPFRLHGIPQEFLGHAKRAVDPGADRARRPEPGPRHRRGRDGTARRAVIRSMPTTPSDRRSRAATVSPSRSLLLVPVAACSASDESSQSPAATARAARGAGGARARRGPRPDPAARPREPTPSRGDDRDAFLAGVDASDPAFLGDQETYFANLEQLPVGEFGYALDPASLTRTGADYWAVVDVTLELDGYDEVPVVTRDRYRFTQRHGRLPALLGHRPDWEDDARRAPQPWDEGPVTVRYGSGVLGIFDAGSARYAGGVVADVETGIADVSARVPYDWEPRVVVYALSDPAFLAGLEDVPGDDPLALDAVAFPVPATPDGEETADTRFLLNPRMLDASGAGPGPADPPRADPRRASGARADGVPTWLSEGIAEYVSVRPLAPEDRVLSRAALAAAEDGLTEPAGRRRVQRRLAEANYGIAWWACEYLAATYDEEMLWFLLESMRGRRRSRRGAADGSAARRGRTLARKAGRADAADLSSRTRRRWVAERVPDGLGCWA